MNVNGKQEWRHGGRTAYHFQPPKNWMNGTCAQSFVASHLLQ
jgi:hypothetical protein